MPVRMGVKMKVPSSRVTPVSVNPWPSCRIVTVAPGMTPPVESLTVPRIVPVSTCATAGGVGAATTSDANSARTRRHRASRPPARCSPCDMHRLLLRRVPPNYTKPGRRTSSLGAIFEDLTPREPTRYDLLTVYVYVGRVV